MAEIWRKARRNKKSFSDLGSHGLWGYTCLGCSLCYASCGVVTLREFLSTPLHHPTTPSSRCLSIRPCVSTHPLPSICPSICPFHPPTLCSQPLVLGETWIKGKVILLATSPANTEVFHNTDQLIFFLSLFLEYVGAGCSSVVAGCLPSIQRTWVSFLAPVPKLLDMHLI